MKRKTLNDLYSGIILNSDNKVIKCGKKEKEDFITLNSLTDDLFNIVIKEYEQRKKI